MHVGDSENISNVQDEITPEAVRDELQRILASETFKRSKNSGSFLSFVVEKKLTGQARCISVKSVLEHLYPSADAGDSDQHTRVRNAAVRLRNALARYNETDGLHDEVRISIPVGSYEPLFSRQPRRNLTVLQGARDSAPNERGDVPHNPRAFELYCEGRRYWGERRPDRVAQAVSCFERAIEAELNGANRPYAEAYAALADCHTFFYVMGGRHEASYSNALSAAAIAVLYGPSSANAHAALGAVTAIFQHNWSDAEREFRKALELDADCLNAHGWYSGHLSCLGRTQEAVYHAQRAMAGDPMSIFTSAHAAKVLYFCRLYDEALELLSSLHDLAPSHFLVHDLLGMTHAALGNLDDAVIAFRKAADLGGGSPLATAPLANVYARMGNRQEAERILAGLDSEARGVYIPKSQVAQIWVGLNATDRAMACLEIALSERDFFLSVLHGWEPFDPIREDSRFQSLLAKLELPARKSDQISPRYVSLR